MSPSWNSSGVVRVYSATLLTSALKGSSTKICFSVAGSLQYSAIFVAQAARDSELSVVPPTIHLVMKPLQVKVRSGLERDAVLSLILVNMSLILRSSAPCLRTERLRKATSTVG